ncbi:hypothetical protein BB560_006165 [Smittium megazygosporum]|uniref:Uncharacterized protein n=1 Tax=Smittium megazygosporum TaxID=133381 RepID=A0A2T9YF02_9FUNG|nr:hypothetical protein BB560_006165 [Smittium megazygosporum]
MFSNGTVDKYPLFDNLRSDEQYDLNQNTFIMTKQDDLVGSANEFQRGSRFNNINLANNSLKSFNNAPILGNLSGESPTKKYNFVSENPRNQTGSPNFRKSGLKDHLEYGNRLARKDIGQKGNLGNQHVSRKSIFKTGLVNNNNSSQTFSDSGGSKQIYVQDLDSAGEHLLNTQALKRHNFAVYNGDSSGGNSSHSLQAYDFSSATNPTNNNSLIFNMSDSSIYKNKQPSEK